MEGQLELLPPIRQDGDKSRKLYAVPNKQTKPGFFMKMYSRRFVKVGKTFLHESTVNYGTLIVKFG